MHNGSGDTPPDYSWTVRVFVTGASGFIGTTLCPALATAGYDVVPLGLRAAGGIELRGASAVVHLAGVAHRHAADEELQRVNVGLTLEVGRAAAAAGARLVYVSSVKVHGDESEAPLTESSPLAPSDAYGRAKARAEEMLRRIDGLDLVVLRPTLVYGPGVKANFLALMRAVASGVPLPLGSIENRRSLLYVANLADAVQRCIGDARAGGQTFLVSDGTVLSTTELCVRLAAALHRRARLFALPASLLRRLPGAAALARSLEVDDSAIRNALGWRPPFALDEGFAATARWFLSRAGSSG